MDHDLLLKTKNQILRYREDKRYKTEPLPNEIKAALVKLKGQFPRKILCKELGISGSSFDSAVSSVATQKDKLIPTVEKFIQIENPFSHQSMPNPILELELPSGMKVRVYA